MKLYLIEIDLCHSATYSMPYYTFTIEAKDEDEATKKTERLINQDYPDFAETYQFATIKEVKTLNDIADKLFIPDELIKQ